MAEASSPAVHFNQEQLGIEDHSRLRRNRSHEDDALRIRVKSLRRRSVRDRQAVRGRWELFSVPCRVEVFIHTTQQPDQPLASERLLKHDGKDGQMVGISDEGKTFASIKAEAFQVEANHLRGPHGQGSGGQWKLQMYDYYKLTFRLSFLQQKDYALFSKFILPGEIMRDPNRYATLESQATSRRGDPYGRFYDLSPLHIVGNCGGTPVRNSKLWVKFGWVPSSDFKVRIDRPQPGTRSLYAYFIYHSRKGGYQKHEGIDRLLCVHCSHRPEFESPEFLQAHFESDHPGARVEFHAPNSHHESWHIHVMPPVNKVFNISEAGLGKKVVFTKATSSNGIKTRASEQGGDQGDLHSKLNKTLTERRDRSSESRTLNSSVNIDRARVNTSIASNQANSETNQETSRIRHVIDLTRNVNEAGQSPTMKQLSQGRRGGAMCEALIPPGENSCRSSSIPVALLEESAPERHQYSPNLSISISRSLNSTPVQFQEDFQQNKVSRQALNVTKPGKLSTKTLTKPKHQTQRRVELAGLERGHRGKLYSSSLHDQDDTERGLAAAGIGEVCETPEDVASLPRGGDKRARSESPTLRSGPTKKPKPSQSLAKTTEGNSSEDVSTSRPCTITDYAGREDFTSRQGYNSSSRRLGSELPFSVSPQPGGNVQVGSCRRSSHGVSSTVRFDDGAVFPPLRANMQKTIESASREDAHETRSVEPLDTQNEPIFEISDSESGREGEQSIQDAVVEEEADNLSARCRFQEKEPNDKPSLPEDEREGGEVQQAKPIPESADAANEDRSSTETPVNIAHPQSISRAGSHPMPTRRAIQNIARGSTYASSQPSALHSRGNTRRTRDNALSESTLVDTAQSQSPRYPSDKTSVSEGAGGMRESEIQVRGASSRRLRRDEDHHHRFQLRSSHAALPRLELPRRSRLRPGVTPNKFTQFPTTADANIQVKFSANNPTDSPTEEYSPANETADPPTKEIFSAKNMPNPAEGRSSATKIVEPATEECGPANNMRHPTTEELPPANNMRHPTTEELPPANNMGHPTTEAPPPTCNDDEGGLQQKDQPTLGQPPSAETRPAHIIRPKLIPKISRTKRRLPHPPRGVTFYRNATKRKLQAGEQVSDSDIEPDQKSLRLSHEHELDSYKKIVPPAFLEFYKAIDAHLMEERPSGDCYIADSMKRFAWKNHTWLSEVNERTQAFASYLMGLDARNVIDTACYLDCIKIVKTPPVVTKINNSNHSNNAGAAGGDTEGDGGKGNGEGTGQENEAEANLRDTIIQRRASGDCKECGKDVTEFHDAVFCANEQCLCSSIFHKACFKAQLDGTRRCTGSRMDYRDYIARGGVQGLCRICFYALYPLVYVNDEGFERELLRLLRDLLIVDIGEIEKFVQHPRFQDYARHQILDNGVLGIMAVTCWVGLGCKKGMANARLIIKTVGEIRDRE